MRLVPALLLLALAFAAPAAAESVTQCVHVQGSACATASDQGRADARTVNAAEDPVLRKRATYDLGAKATPEEGVRASGYAWHASVGRTDPALRAGPSTGGALAGATLASPVANADAHLRLTGTRVSGCAFTSAGSIGCF